MAAAGAEEGSLRELRLEVRSFLEAQRRAGAFVPAVDGWQSGIDPEFSRALGGRGLVGMTVPVEYGGHGRTQAERYVVLEELLASGAPVAAHWVADRQMAPAILKHGTPAQRERLLPGIAAGERLFAIGMSEPDAGSDLASIRTRARREGGGWRLRGTKVWTSGAHRATNALVLARTADSETRHAGLSQFVVDLPHPDIHVKPLHTIDGGSHFNEVVLDDAWIPEAALLGQEGAGWAQVTAELAYERSGPERLLTTMPLLRAWDAARRREATSLGPRDAIGPVVSRVIALREMSRAVAEVIQDGGDPAVAAAMVKDSGTLFEQHLVDEVRRAVDAELDPDAAGLTGLLAQAVLRAPAFTLRGGANEVLRSIIVKGLR
ncbi:acyl-CoA dehydrogenase family protein [Nocardioides sp. CBS4Y-1]|uniref:Acyl-CoA dehydrogenase family protein n=1 Tax=Nocardioides acrostichi TaxID=2784339 RepID=A0A930V3F9_9ACTN|nr:acyl-CoA dehydrogenase family protein [Nocardioides acrostichi]